MSCCGIKKNVCLQYAAAITGGLLSIAFGTNTSWTSPYLLYLTSDESHIPMTSEESSWIAIAPLLGCGLGAILASYLPDRIGRKNSLLCLSPMVLLSYLGIGFVRHVWVFFALRFIIGIADGATYTVLPMYVGEIADPNIRDFLNSINCAFFTFGGLFINIIGPFLTTFAASMVCAVIPLVHFFTFILMPESPYYLIKKNRIVDAEDTLRKLTGEQNVSKVINIIKEGMSRECSNGDNVKFTDLITIKSNRRACSIFLVLILAAKTIGKNPLMIYTQLIFEETGSSIDSTLSTIIYSSIELIVMLVAVLFILNRIGKKVLIMTSTGGTSLIILILAVYFHLKDINSSILKYLNWLPLTLLILFNILYSIGLSFGPYSYLSELFPSNVKSKATCMAEFVTVVLGALVSKFFQLTFEHFGTMSVPFFCFAVLTTFVLFFIIRLVPVIDGKSLEEIQYILNKENPKNKTDPSYPASFL